MPRNLAALRCEHCEAFVHDQLNRQTASTANTRYRGRQRFFRWVEDEGEVDIKPMRRMRPPKFEERVPDVLEVDDLRRLMDARRGRAFEARRDLAILLLLIGKVRRARLRIPGLCAAATTSRRLEAVGCRWPRDP